MSRLFYLLRLLQGVGFACLFTSSGTAIVDVVPVEKRAQGLGIFGACTISSYAVGPTIGEWMINNLGFGAFFPYASSFSLISLVLVSVVREPSFTPSGSSSYGLDFFRLFLLRRYTILLFTNLVMGGGLGSILNFLPAFVKPKGLSISSFFLLYTITIAGVRFLGGKVSDTLGRRKVIIPALFVFSVSIALVGFINSIFVLLSIAVVFGASYGLLYPTLSALVMDRTDPGGRGKATGAFNICFSAGVNFFSFGFGVIARDLGFEAMYLTSAGFVMAGFLLFVFLER